MFARLTTVSLDQYRYSMANGEPATYVQTLHSTNGRLEGQGFETVHGPQASDNSEIIQLSVDNGQVMQHPRKSS
jgi:hypothetical protein